MKAKANLVLLSEKVDQEDSGWESVYEDNDINVNTKLCFPFLILYSFSSFSEFFDIFPEQSILL